MSSDNTEENQTQNVGNYDEDIKKYTKIDNLDEDPVVENGKYFLISFISPEGVMNCTTRGLKIRTYKNKVCFATLEEAKVAAEEINKKDKYFNVFVGESGKWMGWDPAPDDRTKVESEKWANSEQDALMQKMREKEDKQYNEDKQGKQLNELNALVGKKKDIINKEGKDHKKRVAQALKDSAKPQESQTEVVSEETMKEEAKQVSTKHSSRNALVIREKLRKKLQEKKMNDPSLEKPIDTSENLKEKLIETTETKSKIDENIKKLTDILNKAKTKQ
jgi:hypothetical protein